jgi:hypothetical protein
MDYTGNCHATCTSCHSPSATGCYDCVVNAHRNESGACTCQRLDWCANCSVWTGDCHNRCDDSAPDHPHTSARNLTRTPTETTTVSAPATETGMNLTARTTPNSATTPVWAAPDLTPTTVLRVSTTPISTETCECEDNWGNLDCSRWIGACHSRCNGCHRR